MSFGEYLRPVPHFPAAIRSGAGRRTGGPDPEGGTEDPVRVLEHLVGQPDRGDPPGPRLGRWPFERLRIDPMVGLGWAYVGLSVLDVLAGILTKLRTRGVSGRAPR